MEPGRESGSGLGSTSSWDIRVSWDAAAAAFWRSILELTSLLSVGCYHVVKVRYFIEHLRFRGVEL
jgi:hypothetical protein